MSQPRDAYVNLDARARRKVQDERRMHFRRAIESYDEQRQLHAQLMEYPDLLMISPLLDGLPARHQSGQPAH
ncbi:hypothetical protein EA797_20190 [Stutzerimonas zhaodongensis]|uniref:Transcriptional regulator n=1 Tax=Stutzerimonas zhaodongensis TaxID=1176257 RepID=A0A3M2HPZ4_9GAMM|nr:hypothetical protein [Stutzerimonas zhaodongensis]MCQ2031587.1 hypothetical protein [Stutzerimonas zhaodongensis]MCQ4318035.1 hypothetical protein [Stutzerimonas zhaodongensis]RMH87814.1 hypothetical protein EA797_20190 [Stutzerimonas zhaodongensis]